MKYSILICIFYLTHINHALAQSSDALQYYNLCNKAELAICDSDIKGALEYYRSAFLINPDKPFSQDLLNAFHCAMDNDQFTVAEAFLKKILSRGVKQKYLNSQILEFYKDDKLGKIKDMLKRHPNDSMKGNSYALKMNELLKRDQGARRYFMEKGMDNYMTDSVKKNDKIVSNELYTYLITHGVKNSDSLGHFGGEINNNVAYSVIILHQKQAASLGEVPEMPFDSILYQAVLNYDYPPKLFLAQLYDGNKIEFQKRYPAMKNLRGLDGAYYNDTLFVESIDPENKIKIDEAYVQLGLPRYDETIKKVAFRNRCELTGGSLSKYKVENTICSIMYCETEAGIKNWKSEFQKGK